MNAVASVADGSCTNCDGPSASNCEVATCAAGYHTFENGDGCTACADVMNAVASVADGSCTNCDGPSASNCEVATCAAGYHTFENGDGCTACASQTGCDVDTANTCLTTGVLTE